MQRYIADWLSGKKQLLVLAHERPDGDAFGALYGFCLLWRAAGGAACGFLREPLPARYRFLPQSPGVVAVAQLPEGAAFDGVVCVDTSSAERVEWPPLAAAARSALPLLNLDHHGDNRRFGQVNHVDPDMASTTQLLVHIAADCGWPLTADAAAWLLAGLVMDTGAFQFANTSPGVLRDAAALVDAGAGYARLMDGLFFHQPLGRCRLAARLVETARFAHGGRLAYAVLDPAWFDELGVPRADTEGLIDSLRGLDGVDIACLIQPDAGHIRLSLRARSNACAVDRIAHVLGGGGHPLAAGAKVLTTEVDEAVRLLLLETGKTLTP